MDVIFTKENVIRKHKKYLIYTLIIPGTLVSLLTIATGALSDYRSEISPNRSKESPAQDIEAWALRIEALQTEATRLDQLGQQLVSRTPPLASDFSVSWDKVISQQQALTKSSVRSNAHTSTATNWPRSLRSEFPHPASLESRAYSIRMVSEDLLLNSCSRKVSILPDGWPLKQGRVSSRYGWRGRRMHKGLDIAAPRGTPVFAVEEGLVTRSQSMRGYGRLVEIQHSNVYSTRYGHNSRNLVKEGDYVQKGQMIALVGSTGRSTGPHVHFEVRQIGTAINPVKYLGAMDAFTLTSNIKLSEYVELSKK